MKKGRREMEGELKRSGKELPAARAFSAQKFTDTKIIRRAISIRGNIDTSDK
jgi:hypothetical protein